MKKRVSVLDVLIDPVSMDEAVARVEALIGRRQTALVATANAEMVMLAQRDAALAGILNKADLVIPDGAGVVWAARHHRCIMPERVAGYDLMQQLLRKAAECGYRVYFLGGAPGVAEQARQRAQALYRGIDIVGVRDGYFSVQDENRVIADIQALNPHLLFVALGVPKQEKWLAAHLSQLRVPVSIGVGGSFDVMAGVVVRAPVWMQKTGLEWLYRLASQPWRALRMLALPRFMWKVVTYKKVE